MGERILDVKNLKINFHTYAGDVKAIRDVSFHLDKGETLAIVGESGSGKSVTTKSLMGLLANNAEVVGGSIMYRGEDLLKKTEKEMQEIRGKDIAMIFQDALNLDLERLKRCYICEVDSDYGMVPFCAYNLTNSKGIYLYRK